MGITKEHDILKSVIEAVPYGMVSFNQDGRVTVANKHAIDLLGLRKYSEDIVGLEVLTVIDNIHELKASIRECLKSGRKNFDLEEIFCNEKCLNLKGRRIVDGMIITVADITDLKESETLSLNAMLEAQELERKRLAAEIHDGVGPILSTVKMNLAAIEDNLDRVDRELGSKFRKSYKMIDEVADDLRSISHNLMPRVLSDFGLVEALSTLCEKVDASKSVNVNFLHSGMKERLEEIVELGLYRISQELINNTLKHAQASNITLQLIHKGEYILLMYEDDGKGFDTETVPHGLGLLNIENRAKAMAGEMRIDSFQGKGMTATVEAYLNPLSS